ncbi:MAG: CHASE2 domain-containing protein [Chitinophagaceae bacterium]|nr:CHASE2 domain-containing protein [Chitinophagaceae bacterium]
MEKHHGHSQKKKQKIHHRITKYLYEKDTLFATLWVFIFIVVLGSLPLNLGFLNPVKLNLKDFDFSDISYSKLSKDQAVPVDSNIVIINIANYDREGIAYLIEKTASYEPKVIGLDATFPGPKEPEKDSMLRNTIRKHKNLVLAVKYLTDSTNKIYPAENYFLEDSLSFGYVNFPHLLTETIRTYYPFRSDDKEKQLMLPSFTSAIIKKYKPELYDGLKKKKDKRTIINYTRRLSQTKAQYYKIEPEALLSDNVEPSLLKGKIVLLGYVNLDPNDIQDKKFTPMNEKYYGKTIPDMNGIVVHANILSMILEKNFVKKMPAWGNILLAVLICWLHMSLFIHYYIESHIWFHLAAKIAQVASAILFVWLGFYLYDRFRLKVDMKLSLLTIILAVDVIYFYEAWAIWMNKKFHYNTIFKPHHH